MTSPSDAGSSSQQAVAAAESATASIATTGRSKRSLPWPTFGGLQFWGDVHFFRDWRIQRHAYRDQFRLLGPGNLRWAQGDERTCREALARIIVERKLEAPRGPAVVILHGLIRTRHSMSRLAKRLASEGYATYNASYPSTRRPVAWHADHVRKIIAGLESHDEIHLVGYSLGGLLIRATLAEWSDPRLRRIVTIGTPHFGAEKADKWRGWPLFEFVTGEVGVQLGTSERSIVRQLPKTLDLEVGVIAGGRGKPQGYSPILPGDNDWSVTVASARLPGARDFLLVHSHHGFLTTQPKVLDATVRFLRYGYFRSAEEREPIPLESAGLADSARSSTS